MVVLATCNLNQWAMDFDGNLARISTSIELAKEKSARYRLGPELEITGYSCEDSFLELDTFRHSWECLAEILKTDLTDDIICDIGMPIIHRNLRYNCRIILLDRKILAIRPKQILANDGNYREARWFVPWQEPRTVEKFPLPHSIGLLTAQKNVPFGDFIIATNDTSIGLESCEELFAPHSPHIELALNGVEIIANASASHHELRKLHRRIELIRNATIKSGAVYLYANQSGCDGGRLYFDGSASIAVNGKFLAQASQFSMDDVEVITAKIDLNEVRSNYGSIASRTVQASNNSSKIPPIEVDFTLAKVSEKIKKSEAISVRYRSPEEEIAQGPACWLWDYLRRSGANGFFLPSSGGLDSASVATIVGSMCHLVVEAIGEGNEEILRELRRIVGEPENGHYTPTDPREVANRIFYSCYMSTENSSQATKTRAKNLSIELGSNHRNVDIDRIVKLIVSVFIKLTNKKPNFKINGGTAIENRALQNVQARTRMIFSYLLAQLTLWSQGRKGSLLVLGSSNVDESLIGYLTKYDCSSADLNPIGGLSKNALRRFLRWATDGLGYGSLAEILAAEPTAELEPIGENYSQSDEGDIGLSYEELSLFGTLRKVNRLGPVGMFEALLDEWPHLPPIEVAEKVKLFFRFYSTNRHKMTTVTPSYHAEPYSPDDNRFDLRHFLYNVRWSWQFRAIDRLVENSGRRL